MATADGVRGGDDLAPLDYLLLLQQCVGAAQQLDYAISKVVQRRRVDLGMVRGEILLRFGKLLAVSSLIWRF